MRQRIIGRTCECEQLTKCMEKDGPQLIALSGRRRIGKTYLIHEFFDQDFAFRLTGMPNQPAAQLMDQFAEELGQRTGRVIDPPQNWFEAFDSLRTYLASGNPEEKQVVFLDEIPWMDTPGSGFLSAFEKFWEEWGRIRQNLVLIITGSAVPWMNTHVFQDPFGIYRETMCALYLKPFSLSEADLFLKFRGIQLSQLETAMCWMIMGGVPYYLNLLRRKTPLAENIDQLFFQKGGPLRNEFSHLFHSMFPGGAGHIRVAEALSQDLMGLTAGELSDVTRLPENGRLSAVLEELTASGFVRVTPLYGGRKKDQLYHLCDPYTLFYFRFMRDNYGVDEIFWTHSKDYPSRRTWARYAFEQLCRDHMPQIRHKLGISDEPAEEYVWYSRGNTQTGRSGTQIDLMLASGDRVKSLCEMKFAADAFVIDRDYEAVLRSKISALQAASQSSDPIPLAMIAPFGVRHNMYSSAVQTQVTLNDLFLPWPEE